MAEVLSECPFLGDDDTELLRFSRILQRLSSDSENCDLAEAVRAILAYEDSYRLVTLGLERLLWLCKNLPAASIKPRDIQNDLVLKRIYSELPGAGLRFTEALDSAQTELFRHDLHRLEDTRRFLERASAACSSPDSLVNELMERHADIQRGKFDKGRRKMPWLEVTAGRISLTMTRVGGLNREVIEPSHLVPHPYRLASAGALVRASRSV